MEQYDVNMYNLLYPQSSTGDLENFSNNAGNTSSGNNAKNLFQPKTAFPAETPVAMAYIPYQMWEKPYDDIVGFQRGTIFPSLDKPFIGEEAVNNVRQR